MKRPPAIVERDRPAPGKKNTRRWCRGKVGRPHQWAEVDWWQLRGAPGVDMRVAYIIEWCTACEKHGRWLDSIALDDEAKGWILYELR